MKKVTKILAVALVGAMMMSAAACGARSKSADATTVAMHNTNSLKGADIDSYYDDVEYDGEWGAIEETIAAEDYYEQDAVDNSQYSNSGTGTTYPANTMLIRRVNMDVETTSYDSVNRTISDKVNELGGYIESSNARGTGKNGDLRSISYVIRVPIDKLDALVNTVGTACTVLSSSENTEDVTLQYSDVKAHIQSLRVEQETLLNLLAQADSLEAIITLQGRLTEVRYEIESYESRAKVLENQSSYSTLSLNVREVLEVTEQVETKKLSFGEEIWEGLKESLTDIREDGKDFIIGFVSALPYLLIFAIIVVIIVLIVKGIIKSTKKKAAKKAAAAPAPKAPAAAPEAPAAKAETQESKTE
ncbi:protein of unknown function [Ruminococcaceae bacterium YRB3002]|nr:protein of unknown function [Ruminococcaceae bacterium YRB3002]